MPVDKPSSCHERLTAAVSSAKPALTRIEDLITTQPVRTGGSSAGKPGTKPPWHPVAASLVFDIHTWARDTENTLRVFLTLPVRPRGGSDVNTLIALDNIVTLGNAAGDERGFTCAIWLERWHGRAKRALGEASEIRRLPRQPGESERACPFCACLTLRYWPLHGIVRCINPGCRDDEDRRPVAKIEYSGFTHQIELVWQDSVVGLPPAAGQAVA